MDSKRTYDAGNALKMLAMVNPLVTVYSTAELEKMHLQDLVLIGCFLPAKPVSDLNAAARPTVKRFGAPSLPTVTPSRYRRWHPSRSRT